MVSHKKVSFESLVEGKSVAVVGNTNTLFDRTFGEEIDAHDVVIRFNKPANLYCDFDVSKTHGNKIDVWAFWSIGAFIKRTLPHMKGAKLEKEFNENDSIYKIQAAGNGHIRELTMQCDFTFDRSKFQRLNKKLINSSIFQRIEERKYQSYLIRNNNKSIKKIEPSIGITILEWLMHSKPCVVNVYGIDFKKTPTFSELEKYEVDMKGRVDTRCLHNFALEEVYAKKYIFVRDNFNLRE
jgi:hypothetical protein